MHDVWEMKTQATIRLRFTAQKNLNAVLKALAPETLKPATNRSLVKIKGESNVLILRFKAADTSALRAVINSYLHWVLLATDTLSKLESPKKA
jgi:tRNA threonylcarbamoyladenosine modification (KEOPS) complex  Pcc1 subunit